MYAAARISMGIQRRRSDGILRLIFLLGLACLLPPSLFAQEIQLPFKRISLEDGLSQGSVYDIQQDSIGFMWFATADGLNRYDGYTFKVYKSIPGDSTSLGNNELNTLYVDRSGVLWVGTWEGGLNRYDPSSDHFVRYLHDPDDATSISNNTIENIYEDHDGTLWVSTDGGGLNKFDRTSGSFSSYRSTLR